jgi:UDP-glucose 4-epimerase
MRVLVIGGAGFIGSHVVRHHLDKGDEVGIVDKFTTGKHSNLHGLKYKSFYHADDKSVQWADKIYLLAGSVGVKYVNNNPYYSMKNNMEVIKNTLASNDHYKRPMIFASSSEVYGNSKDVPFKEDADLCIGRPDQGRWGYSCSKLMSEFLALHSECPAVVVRFFNVVGVRQVADYGMVLPSFITKAMDDEPLEIYGDGKAVRCFCDVEEVVPLLSDLLDNEECHNQVFNVGNPSNQVTIEELANIVSEEVGSFSEIKKIDFDKVFEKNPTDILVRIPSIDKVTKYTGWVPKNTVKDIVKKMVESGVYTNFHK